MNNWLKLALYSLIGIIIGNFALGIIAPGYNTNNMNVPGQMQMNMMQNMGGMQGGMNNNSSGGMGGMGGMM